MFIELTGLTVVTGALVAVFPRAETPIVAGSFVSFLLMLVAL